MSVITNIGLDHCDMLGGTLPEIAFEKAGIIKPKSPVVIGESHPEIDAVFERKVLYTNLPEAEFMGNRAAIMSLLTFADKAEPSMWQEHEGLLARMDLRGSYQQKNLRTVLAALDVLSKTEAALAAAIAQDRMKVLDALAHTASRTGFAGRWQKLSDHPYVICDIGHNGHGLKYNFAQLAQMKREGECSHIIIVYGSVADKDVDAALELMPEDIVCIFTQAQGKRAMPAEQVKEKYLNFCAGAARSEGEVHVAGTVLEAVRKAMQAAAGIKAADPQARPLIYVGGSTYVVAEAAACIR
jgi:dihydrofolate synthase/folylpolyglutamate synthase